MGLFESASTEEGITRAQKRVKNLGTTDLLDWLETAIPGMQRQLEFYRRTGDKAYLAELGIAEMTCSIVVTELMDRNG